MSSLDVILVGPMAPPRGGVSAHVGRLVLLLAKDGLRVGILDHFNHARDPASLQALTVIPCDIGCICDACAHPQSTIITHACQRWWPPLLLAAPAIVRGS
jgi:hypothetical protein